MPFLLPALSAAFCDAVVIYLSRHDGSIMDGLEDSQEEPRLIYQSKYLLLLAGVRLFLLVVPLPYHSYTGTAVKCPSSYQVLYGGSIFVIFIHMLALSMLDPNSLNSFLPMGQQRRKTYSSESGNNRRARQDIWLLLTCSLVSNLCHLILFLHVRSTAPATADIPRKQRHKVLFYYVKEQREDQNESNDHTERESLLNSVGTMRKQNKPQNFLSHAPGNNFPELVRRGSDSSINRMQRMTNEFMLEIQTRIQKAKSEWTKRLDDYRIRSANGGAGAGSNHDILHRPLTPFRVLLQLFAYEEVLANGRLDAIYDLDDGEALIFFVPQLISFLLHGAYDSSPQLEEWLLDTCRRNIYFAHRCYWFLRAWCLEKTHDAAVDNSSRRLSRSSSTDSLADGTPLFAPDDPIAVERYLASSLTSVHSNGNLSQASITCENNKLSPEERTVLEALMARVAEYAEAPARLLNYGSGQDLEHSSSPNSPRHGYSNGSLDSDLVDYTSRSDLMVEVEAGTIPVDPQSGLPSMKHWDCVAAGPRKFGFLPLGRDASDSRPSQQHGQVINNGLLPTNALQRRTPESCFDATPVFFDALLTIADNLFRCPREQRTEELHSQLRSLEVQTLPSNSIYIPVQEDVNHRVWRIAAEESIAISTKERVPCIICLEVVEYSRDEVPKARDFRRLLDRRAAAARSHQEAVTNIVGGGSLGGDLRLSMVGVGSGPLPSFRYSPSLTEKELVHHWRYGYRDPHRQDTALEKLAYSMRHGIRRIPLDQMKNQMKAQIEKLRNTQSNIHDILTLYVPESFSDDEDNGDRAATRTSSGLVHTMDSIQRKDIERGSNDGSPSHEIMNQPLESNQTQRPQHRPRPPPSPTRSPVARTKMGQWTSPHHSVDRPMGRICQDELDDSLMIPSTAKAGVGRKDPTADDSDDTRLHLHRAYGSSGHRRPFNGTPSPITSRKNPEVKNASSTKKRSRTPPRPPTKPPPVVFKENWRQKEERLRSSSLYGSHPGWRLLPLLVKANDDLRQEQLASQLIYRMALILARENVPVWLCPYEILATTDRGGIIEAIPDTISIASLKKNDPNFSCLKDFFISYFDTVDSLADAKANFCESLAAYSMVCYFLQIKDRHNGNILLDNHGHLIHIDFGFFFLSSPGKNTGFESAPFKLTRDFVDLLDGPDSHLFRTFRVLCYRTFIALRRHCMEVILLVEMLKKGNEDLACFRGRPDDAIHGLRQRFRLDLNDRACMEYVNALVDESLENWRTNWYDRYQRYCVGIL